MWSLITWGLDRLRSQITGKRERDKLRRDLYVRLMAAKLSYPALLADGKNARLSDCEVRFLSEHLLRVRRAARRGARNVAKYEDDEKHKREEIETKLHRILRVPRA